MLWLAAPDAACYTAWFETLVGLACLPLAPAPAPPPPHDGPTPSFSDVLSPSSPSSAALAAPPPRVARTSTVRVVEAKNLPRAGDYHCIFAVAGARLAATPVITGTSNPFWGTTIALDKLPVPGSVLTIQLMRYVCLVRACACAQAMRPRAQTPRACGAVHA